MAPKRKEVDTISVTVNGRTYSAERTVTTSRSAR